MPLSQFDTSQPLIESYIQTIDKPFPFLSFDWTTATQSVDPDGNILNRTFSELEVSDVSSWSIVPGKLGDNGSPIHFESNTSMLSHRYSASKVQSQLGSLAGMSDFNGWNYLVEDYSLYGLYQDKLVRTITWDIYNKSFADSVTGGPFVGSPSDESIVIPTKGCAVRIETSSSFIASSGNSKENATLIPISSTPSLLYGNQLYLDRPEVTRSVGNPEDPPVLVMTITIRFYGAYYSQALQLSEMYDQGWLVHLEETDLDVRLKPPGKQHLDDSFIGSVGGVETGLNPSDV